MQYDLFSIFNTTPPIFKHGRGEVYAQHIHVHLNYIICEPIKEFDFLKSLIFSQNLENKSNQ